jgi:acetyl esterase/lipase
MTLSKDDVALSLAPFLAAGWAVANVDYRLGFEATAPAAAHDVRCAVKFAAREAARHGADASRLVLVGESAGAHLVLLAAFADSAAGLDASCPEPMPRVAGVIDWAGPTDVVDLLAGENQRGWATGWIGSAPGAEARADTMSPLRWVRPGLPRVLIIHGDADQTVPYSHSARLARALDAAGVPNVLLTLDGEDHGPYAPAHAARAWATAMGWLAEVGGAGVH